MVSARKWLISAICDRCDFLLHIGRIEIDRVGARYTSYKGRRITTITFELPAPTLPTPPPRLHRSDHALKLRALC